MKRIYSLITLIALLPSIAYPASLFEKKAGIHFNPRASDPSVQSAGDTYYNSTSTSLKFYNGSVWSSVGSGSGGGGGINYVTLGSIYTATKTTNSDAETSVGDWAAYADAAGTDPVDMTGGSPAVTISRTTTAGHILNGTASFEVVKTAANKQGEGVSDLVYVPPAYRGQNAQITIPFSIFSGSIASGDLKISAYDVTNSALLGVSNGTITGTGLLIANLVIPSTTVQMRIGFHFASTATTAVTFDFDDVILGPPSNVGSVNTSSDDVAYTPTINGLGTATNISFFYKRIGDYAFIHGTATAGTAAASQMQVTLPTGLTIDTNKVPSGGAVVGTLVFNGSGLNGTSTVIANGGNSYLQFGQQTSAVSHAVTPENGNVWTSSNTFGFGAMVPITQWAATGTAFRPDQVANSWSGYHDSTCSWARTNTSFGDPTADTTCVFTEVFNTNFGTVTSYKSGSDYLPGVVFTPSRAGKYWVCAIIPVDGDTLGAGTQFRLYDGTIADGHIVSSAYVTTAVTSDTVTVPLCGFYNATSTSPVTLRIESKATSGSVSIGFGGPHSVEWSIFQIDQQMPATLLVNSVVSGSTGVEVIQRARISNTADPCAITSQSGSAFSLDTASGTAGICKLNIAAGTFSAKPTCVCTTEQSAINAPTCNVDDSTLSTTKLKIWTATGNAGTVAGYSFGVICMGPK